MLDAAMELGYVTYKIPVKYHKGVRSIMIISHYPEEIFYQKIISAIERTFRFKGYACYLSYTEGNLKQASELVDTIGEHLLRLGHRRFAFLGVPNVSSCPERRKGIEKRLAESGLKLDPKFAAYKV
ncbi:LacI family DNA-binding transcriptional regulator, partial [bacterium]|nr:LacI family DNA-binding transcriptional regulator [bacterium]